MVYSVKNGADIKSASNVSSERSVARRCLIRGEAEESLSNGTFWIRTGKMAEGCSSPRGKLVGTPQGLQRTCGLYCNIYGIMISLMNNTRNRR